MNNKDFENNFITVLKLLNVNDYLDRRYIINPIFEEKKHYNELDDMVRHFILPKQRKVLFHDFVKVFTFQEGYYPCWIEIINVDSDIIINTSLRMRKLKETKRISEYHPFFSKLIN